MERIQLFSKMKIRHITWQEFDEAVAKFPKPIGDGFYAIPRGGLCLAVALSHRFDKPILSSPTKLSIFVDDIVDSGRTLAKMRLRYGGLPCFALVKRASCNERAINYIWEMKDEDWIVFPWENKDKVKDDYEKYISR